MLCGIFHFFCFMEHSWGILYIVWRKSLFTYSYMDGWWKVDQSAAYNVMVVFSASQMCNVVVDMVNFMHLHEPYTIVCDT